MPSRQSERFNRHLRDLRTLTQHAYLSADRYERRGSYRSRSAAPLGLPPSLVGLASEDLLEGCRHAKKVGADGGVGSLLTAKRKALRRVSGCMDTVVPAREFDWKSCLARSSTCVRPPR